MVKHALAITFGLCEAGEWGACQPKPRPRCSLAGRRAAIETGRRRSLRLRSGLLGSRLAVVLRNGARCSSGLCLAMFAASLTGCRHAQPANDLTDMSMDDLNEIANETAIRLECSRRRRHRGAGGDVHRLRARCWHHPASSGQHYEFGASQVGNHVRAPNVRGTQTGDGTVRDCTGGLADYADFSNLRVYFQNEPVSSAGMRGGQSAVGTSGASARMPRDDITDMGEENLRVFNSPRGVEFEADGSEACSAATGLTASSLICGPGKPACRGEALTLWMKAPQPYPSCVPRFAAFQPIRARVLLKGVVPLR